MVADRELAFLATGIFIGIFGLFLLEVLNCYWGVVC